MAKKVFVFLTFVVLILLAAMAFSKPEPWEHQAAVRQLAMNVVSQEVSNAQLPDELVTAGTDVAMNAAGSFLQSSMQVDDYLVLNVGMVSFHGQTLPITVGAFGKVFVLADEEDVRHIVR
ncbi:hypothetical protein [uncultured Prevotella sp.]|uniref:hypothetical protein n=1 Tax=uncultured Prevotella sp. TaxID=159272 RepID=UPI00258A4331|nr:hypothetical protein [uncultured Prevotella sp.]